MAITYDWNVAATGPIDPSFWTEQVEHFSVGIPLGQSQGAFPTSPLSGTYQFAFYNAASFNQAQSSKGKFYVNGTQIGTTVLMSGLGNSAVGYWAIVSPSISYIYRLDPNLTPTYLGGDFGVGATDTDEIELGWTAAAGGTLTLKIAGSTVGSVTGEATYTSGSPGFMLRANAPAVQIYDVWTATGEIVSGGNPENYYRHMRNRINPKKDYWTKRNHIYVPSYYN